ncbi:MAG: hypothetical protein ABW221_25800 [Vicinamibacteria bacterium]
MSFADRARRQFTPLGLAVMLALAGVAVQWKLHRAAHYGYDRDLLPAYDAYAYVALAEHPRFFTVTPWAYRALTPWVVSLWPGDVVAGFHLVSSGALVLAAVLLFAVLRQLGHGARGSLLAMVAFLFASATGEIVQYPFLADPVTLALVMAFLWLLERGEGAGTLALVAVAGGFAKELQALVLPVVFFARVGRDGPARALGKTAAVGAATLAAMLVLRTWVALPQASVSVPPLAAVWAAFVRDWPETWRGALLSGLLPLGLAGALLPRAWPFLRRDGYALAITLATPFAAWAYVGDPRVIFFGKNAERVLVYALPFLLALALHLADRLRGAPPAVPRAAVPLPGGVSIACGAAAVLALVTVALGLDRYRRLDLRATRDGPLLLTFVRQSLAEARRLERGRFVVLDPARDVFVAGQSDARDLGRMRWYLRDGWGPRPSSSSGAEVVMQERRATVVLPCLRPDDWQVSLWLSSPLAADVDVEVNGHPLGRAPVTAEAARHLFAVPADALFRGDNLLALAAPSAAPVRLHRVAIRPPGAAGD